MPSPLSFSCRGPRWKTGSARLRDSTTVVGVRVCWLVRFSKERDFELVGSQRSVETADRVIDSSSTLLGGTRATLIAASGRLPCIRSTSVIKSPPRISEIKCSYYPGPELCEQERMVSGQLAIIHTRARVYRNRSNESVIITEVPLCGARIPSRALPAARGVSPGCRL